MAVQLRSFAEALNPRWEFFEGDPDERFLGDMPTMLAMGGVYLASLTALKLAVRDTEKYRGLVQVLSVVNNVVMCLYSAYTLVGVAATLLANWAELDFDPLAPFCDPQRRMLKGMDFWFYHFYLSKFWEWIDTWILILKGKDVWPPSNSQYFLHVFHHTTTASIAWFAWRQEFCVAWLGPLTNAFVHTPMYAYYFLTDFWGGVRKFGIYITPIQILQFIVCLFSLIPESLNAEVCQSTPRAIGWMWFTYSIFLCLFVQMFRNKKSARRKAKEKKAA